MNILSLRAAAPHLFHPTQDWFLGEAFMTRECPLPLPSTPPLSVLLVPLWDILPPAVTLVALYVQHPGDAVWQDYLWTRDTDAYGQRVYVGGTANGRGLEIHRHLEITSRWGVPTWPVA